MNEGCINCDAVREGNELWFIGLVDGGQACYACPDCKNALYSPYPLMDDTPATTEGDCFQGRAAVEKARR